MSQPEPQVKIRRSRDPEEEGDARRGGRRVRRRLDGGGGQCQEELDDAEEEEEEEDEEDDGEDEDEDDEGREGGGGEEGGGGGGGGGGVSANALAEALAAGERKGFGSRTYDCPFPGCGKSFTRRFNLRSHALVHSEQRPFACGHCHLGFARSDALRRHLEVEEKRDGEGGLHAGASSIVIPNRRQLNALFSSITTTTTPLREGGDFSASPSPTLVAVTGAGRGRRGRRGGGRK
ncbi:hypothetical protein HDU67_008612, partial [Dinochytrium kinnereticum]